MDVIREYAKKHGLEIISFGHIGDGNFHPNPLRDLYDRGLLSQVKREIYTETIKLGGVITGEHGIGAEKVQFMHLLFSEDDLEAQRKLKRVFDPNGLANPGKVLPEVAAVGEAR